MTGSRWKRLVASQNKNKKPKVVKRKRKAIAVKVEGQPRKRKPVAQPRLPMPQHALIAMPPLEKPEEKSEVPLEKK